MFLSNTQGEFKMFKRNRKLMFNWFGSFMIVFLIGLLLPAGSVLAQTPIPPTSRKESALQSHLTRLIDNPAVRAPAIMSAATNLIQDPSFESFIPPTSDPYWVQSDNVFGTPL